MSSARLLFAVVCLSSSALACRPDAHDETDSVSWAVSATPANLPPALDAVPVPEPPDLDQYIADKSAAIALGKALFWDMQIGSDGKTACATCHFQAGADGRTRNQLAPGLLRKDAQLAPSPDKLLGQGGMNYRLQPSDFPFHRLANPDDRSSAVIYDSNDVVASQGVTYATFLGLKKKDSKDNIASAPDPDGFTVGPSNVRRVEPRNTPSVVNAVFNFRQFWDGRAQDEFNGVNSFGERDPYAFVYKADAAGALTQTRVRIKNASLASQALAPPLSSFEMSANGRTFTEIGDTVASDRKSSGRGKKLFRKTAKKLTGLPTLGKQLVAPDDSVLGSMSNSPNNGLNTSYEALIQRAFKPAWWQSDASYVRVDPATGERTLIERRGNKPPKDDEYTLLEYNFSLIFGLSVQLYEATLVSGDTPFDRFLKGNTSALSDTQRDGMALFYDTVRVRCVNCHGGAELTDASHTKIKVNPLRRREINLLDRGFHNLGLRPTLEDLGVGDTDPWGVPLSMARLATMGRFTDPTVTPPVGANELLGDDGAFKAPGLRNVALTAPYFHNGGMLTLRQVIDFYSRGGDFTGVVNRSGQTIAGIHVIGLSEAEKSALEAFMQGLTDERVRLRKAPFDHPELRVPNGHQGDTMAVVRRADGQPEDRMRRIAPVGASGGDALPNFLSTATDDDGPDED